MQLLWTVTVRLCAFQLAVGRRNTLLTCFAVGLFTVQLRNDKQMLVWSAPAARLGKSKADSTVCTAAAGSCVLGRETGLVSPLPLNYSIAKSCVNTHGCSSGCNCRILHAG